MASSGGVDLSGVSPKILFEPFFIHGVIVFLIVCGKRKGHSFIKSVCS